ncbi:hypothetical protein VST7929_00672 [Vibrio stylophorae]|uniref:Uncharacterized protein n=1 Tax=Vibrio stylophorae TaxID=659351 RepID=A0ABM8ZR98_9VIBR|nr:hypothetical protein [Vibrio stylophorae]CAH0532825.1 hypothetical protein VST7929_00672 [Vibrio stylophorae]
MHSSSELLASESASHLGRDVERHLDCHLEIDERALHLLKKRSRQGKESLSYYEQLYLCFWAVDYSLEHHGDLSVADDFEPNAVIRFFAFAQQQGWPNWQQVEQAIEEQQLRACHMQLQDKAVAYFNGQFA